MDDYTKEFLSAWKTYNSPKSSSKSMAYKSWGKLNGSRPEQSLLIAEINCYNQWLAGETSKSGREYPKCHFSTWLNQRRYEGFEDEAKALLARQALPDAHSQADRIASTKTWEGAPMASLMAKLGGSDGDTPRESIFEAWIAPTVMIRSMPIEIRCPSKFHRDYLESKFGKVIRSALGPDTIITVAMDEKKAPAEG